MKKLTWLFAAILALQICLFAASQKSETVKLADPVNVGASTLKAGEYKVTWAEPGPDTKVTFSQGKKEVAVVPATVEAKKNADFRVFTAATESGKVLQGIELKNATLTFGPNAATGK